jgi:hypothetical protein
MEVYVNPPNRNNRKRIFPPQARGYSFARLVDVGIAFFFEGL